MRSPKPKLEYVADLAVTALLALVCIVIARNHFFAPSRASNYEIASGVQIALNGIDWRANGKTLLLVMQKDCKFCDASAPFYRRITAEVAQQPVKVIAVLPNLRSESRAYLGKLELGTVPVRRASLADIGVVGTPTLILVDNDGAVVRSWVGKLTPSQETEVAQVLGAVRTAAR